MHIKYEILNSNYHRKEYETQSLDAQSEVCGGTREALAITRTPSGPARFTPRARRVAPVVARGPGGPVGRRAGRAADGSHKW